MREGLRMKRHADQIAHEKQRNDTLRTLRVTRLQAPYVDASLSHHGDFSCVLAVKNASGVQHNYAMRLDVHECREMGLAQQDRDREMMPDCFRIEEEGRKRRTAAIEYLARQISAAMLDYVETQDPQFGYSPEQWAEMKK